MGDALHGISFGIDPKVLLGNTIAPLNLIILIEHHHTIGGCLDSLNETTVLLLNF